MPVTATIAITPGAGQLLDAVSLTVGSNTVVRETMVIADPTSPTELAAVVGGALIIAGNKTHNAAAPSTNNLGVLAGLANAAAPIYTEGDQVLLSTDLTGALRVNVGSVVASNNITQWDSVALGPPSAYGTSPGAVNVIGVNAFVTNSVAVTGTFFQATQPVSIAGDVEAVQDTAADFNATVVGTGTFIVQASITTLGQQLAAASVPVVLTAAQLTALTPLSTVAVTQSTSPWIVAGGLTNNNAAPSTNNIGALSVLANAADPTWTEGDLVLVSANLAGYQRVLLQAETTKVIGVVRTSDGAGNLLTSNSTTPTAHFALDSNITSILGTAPTTVGKLDVKGADGDVFVRQTTGTNLHVVTDSTSTTAVTQATASSLNAQVQGVAAADAAVSGNPVLIGGVDNAGNVQELPVADSGSTAPAQVIPIGGKNINNSNIINIGCTSGGSLYTALGTTAADATNSNASLLLNDAGSSGYLGVYPFLFNGSTWDRLRSAAGTTGAVAIGGTKTNNNAAPDAANIGVLPVLANAVAPSWTEGDQVLESADLHGAVRTMAGNIPESTAAWTSATAQNTAITMTVTGYSTVVVTLNQGTTITGGSVSFEVSDANSNWYAVLGQRLGAANQAPVSAYTLAANTNAAFQVSVAGFVGFRLRLNTVISGTATVNVGVQAQALPFSPLNIAVLTQNTGSVQSAAAGSALADNQLNESYFTTSAVATVPMAVGSWNYGGAFSGAADAARQGWSKSRTATVFKTVSATASGNTAIWTPGTGNKFRLLKIFIQITDNASLAAGGTLTVDIQDSSTTTNITFSVFVPTTAVTTTIGDGAEIQLDLGSFGILSAAANNVLNVNLSSALATGVCRVIAMGVEE